MIRALGWFAAALICAAFLAVLLLAAHLGQSRRCDWLTTHHSPNATTYDCTTTGAP